MGFLIFLLTIVLIALVLVLKTIYVVEQQCAVVVERLGRYNRISTPGLHILVPFIEKKASKVSLKTMGNEFQIDAKTKDNVTIGLRVSTQFHVDYSMGVMPNQQDSGIYKSVYMLANPVDQMKAYLTDALRSAIPAYDLDDVFSRKDDIAQDVNNTVAQQMLSYGFTIVSTLITDIRLPKEVEDSMNQINAAQRQRTAAQDLAEADRIKVVTEAKAEAEKMKLQGVGIAEQRKAIAVGIRESLSTISETGITPEEADNLFRYTQWVDMMSEFAKQGSASTVVLPSDFNDASTFAQMLAAEKADKQ